MLLVSTTLSSSKDLEREVGTIGHKARFKIGVGARVSGDLFWVTTLLTNKVTYNKIVVVNKCAFTIW